MEEEQVILPEVSIVNLTWDAVSFEVRHSTPRVALQDLLVIVTVAGTEPPQLTVLRGPETVDVVKSASEL